MEAKVYNTQGKESGTVALPESVFGLPWNADLVHTVVVAMQSNARTGVAHTKGRGEVQGGGRKPWQQKGTGRARHGSSRSPIWRGGGVTHGPRNEKVYAKKINQKMRRKALLVALSRKYKDGEVLFVDALKFVAPKAAEAKKFLEALNLQKRSNAALIVMPERHLPTERSFGNFGNVVVSPLADINPLLVLGKKRVVFVDPKAAVETLAKKI